MSTDYVDPWDMLSNFCFHVYAQKVFIGENDNALKNTWSCDKRVHTAGSQINRVDCFFALMSILLYFITINLQYKINMNNHNDCSHKADSNALYEYGGGCCGAEGTVT